MRRRRLPAPVAARAALAALAVLAALVVAACTPGSVKELPAPPSLPSTTATTAPVDLSGVALAAAPGRTTTTVAMGPGGATITGTVVGPDGAVAGAVVHTERLAGDGTASTDVLSAADGTYALPQVLGGRYRVRAWKPAPDNLANTAPAVFFLGGSESKVLNIALQRYDGTDVEAAIAPSPPIVGAPANLVAQVVTRSVANDGVVRSSPVVGIDVQLFGQGAWRLATPTPASVTTDGSGRARWQLTCTAAGAQPLSVSVAGSQTFPLDLPACEVPPPTTTAPPGDTSPSVPSTTAAGPSTTTSTTVRR